MELFISKSCLKFDYYEMKILSTQEFQLLTISMMEDF